MILSDFKCISDVILNEYLTGKQNNLIDIILGNRLLETRERHEGKLFLLKGCILKSKTEINIINLK